MRLGQLVANPRSRRNRQFVPFQTGTMEESSNKPLLPFPFSSPPIPPRPPMSSEGSDTAMAPASASPAREREELVRLRSSKNWSKAIRVLDSLLARSFSIQDLCNRAFCYSRLELHKHVIKDCDKALELDPRLIQAYILKGNALSFLGRKEDALLVWEQGYGNAVQQSADLKQLLELEGLLAHARQHHPTVPENHVVDSSRVEEPVSSSVKDSIAVGDQVVDSSGAITSDSGSGSEHVKESSSAPISEGSEVLSKSDDVIEISNLPSDTSNRSKQTIRIVRPFYVTSNSKMKSISFDIRLSRGIQQVNEGKYATAISIFNQILWEDPKSPEALIGRGTAYAFQRELEAAITDFTEVHQLISAQDLLVVYPSFIVLLVPAIKSNPSAGEAWKRRGQARAALGESAEAIEDLTKALEFEPKSSDILHERVFSQIVAQVFWSFSFLVNTLFLLVSLFKLGLALSAIGEYNKAEEAHLKSIQLDRTFMDGWAHLAQFYEDLANVEKALQCIRQVLLVDGRFAKAYHLRGLLYHGMGQHRIAIKDLSVGLSIESSNIECLYLRGSCYHAIGEYGDAIKDYDAVLDLELDSMDKFVLQCSAFYQKEIALYTASKINSEFCWFDIDGDVDPLFKEYWCKRLHPKYVCERVFRQPPLKESLKKGRLKKQDFTISKQKATLLRAADLIGQKIQYNCPGFLPNKRQYRMAGLAAIEIAQKVAKAWHSFRNTNKNGKKARRRERISTLSQNRGGACCSTSSLSETSTSYGLSEDRSSSGRHLSWHDIYTISVKWRQISEPCDSVVWLNKLSEEFNSGFGSHKPMIHGQAKVVCYFRNYERTLSIAKTMMMNHKCVYNSADNVMDLFESGKSQKIMQSTSCSDLYSIVGENFWVTTTCESYAFEGKQLEGTRIITQKMDKIGFDFAIRTPCTSSRWDDYDEEMAIAWEALCKSYCGEIYGSNDMGLLEGVKDSILRMAYYWYNFMPLSRGSAVVGYTVLLGLFLAANMEVTGNIPPGVQVDWQAILSSTPDAFLDSVKPWLYPSLRFSTAWKDYPDVASIFSTTGSVVSALSSYDLR